MIGHLRLGLAASLLAVASPAPAQEAVDIDPQADQALRRMGDYLANLPHFRVVAEASDDNEIDTGQLVSFGHTLEMVVRRPNRLWAEVRGDIGHKRILYDGQTARLMDYVYGTVATTPGKPTIEATINDLIDRLGVVIPLSELAFDDPYATLMENVQTGSHIGDRIIDGVEHHHLAFTQETIDWEVWIANGARPLPGKMLIRYKEEPGSPQFTAIFTEWDLSDASPETLFSAETPVELTPIDFVEAGGDR